MSRDDDDGDDDDDDDDDEDDDHNCTDDDDCVYDTIAAGSSRIQPSTTIVTFLHE